MTSHPTRVRELKLRVVGGPESLEGDRDVLAVYELVLEVAGGRRLRGRWLDRYVGGAGAVGDGVLGALGHTLPSHLKEKILAFDVFHNPIILF